MSEINGTAKWIARVREAALACAALAMLIGGMWRWGTAGLEREIADAQAINVQNRLERMASDSTLAVRMERLGKIVTLTSIAVSEPANSLDAREARAELRALRRAAP